MPIHHNTSEPVADATITSPTVAPATTASPPPGTPRFLTPPPAGRHAEPAGTAEPVPAGDRDVAPSTPPSALEIQGGCSWALAFLRRLDTATGARVARNPGDPVPAGRPGESSGQYLRRIRLFRVEQAAERILARQPADGASTATPPRTVRRARAAHTPRKRSAGATRAGDDGPPPDLGSHAPAGAHR